jgi:hypothetical protein
MTPNHIPGVLRFFLLLLRLVHGGFKRMENRTNKFRIPLSLSALGFPFSPVFLPLGPFAAAHSKMTSRKYQERGSLQTLPKRVGERRKDFF